MNLSPRKNDYLHRKTYAKYLKADLKVKSIPNLVVSQWEFVGTRGNSVGTRGNSVGTQSECGGNSVGMK